MRVQRRVVAITTLLLLGCITYLVGASVAHLRVEPSDEKMVAQVLARWGESPLPPTPEAAPPRRATAIIERNPFDSVTGPLIGVPIPALPEPEPEVGVDLSNPLAAPRCENVRVYSTVRHPEVERSTAVAQLKEQPQSQLVHIGDELGDKQLAYIGFNRLELSPAAWFVDDEELCQALVFTDTPRFRSAHRDKAKKKRRKRKVKRAKHKRRKKRIRKKRRRRKRPPRLPGSLARKLKKVAPGEYRIDRGVVDELISSGTKWLKRTRMIPVQKDGDVVGMRVSNVGRGTLLSKLGLKNGDQIRRINGQEIANPEKALGAYARLRTASDLSVEISRRGKPVTLDYRIR